MIFSKLEMYEMLAYHTVLGIDAMDIIVKAFGDTSDTYLKVLKAATPFKTFVEFEESISEFLGED